MSFPNESPYEILEITPTAKPNEIIRAYQQAIKKKRYPTPKITQAFNELRNPRLRARHDLFEFWGVGDGAQVDELFTNLPPVSFLPDEVTPVPITPDVIRLTALNANGDFIEPPACSRPLQAIDQYEALENVLLPLQFPI